MELTVEVEIWEDVDNAVWIVSAAGYNSDWGQFKSKEDCIAWATAHNYGYRVL